MPIYEYACTTCHTHCDFLEKINAPPQTICPKCKQSTLKKLVSASGFQLKGSGWYATDFRDKSVNTSTPTDKTPPTD